MPAIDQEFVEKVLAGDFRAIARLLTLVESNAQEAAAYLKTLFPFTGRCFTLGITGAPGAGKSTLVDRLAQGFRHAGRKVGIIAVDPTSPFSGGAILGDRIRMQSRSLDSGTFIRSMATRGHIGGLTQTAGDAVSVLDAAGFDIVMIETVGVGQGEVEVAKMADLTIVLLVPGMGDDIQAMKAGIMEIADIFVINKADHPGADRTAAELKALVSMTARPDGWLPSIVRTVASEGAGLEECIQVINSYRSFLSHSELTHDRKIQAEKGRLLELACTRLRDSLLRDAEASARIQELAVLIADRKIDPFTAAEEVIRLQSNVIASGDD